jgi:2-aminoadipate transaminase
MTAAVAASTLASAWPDRLAARLGGMDPSAIREILHVANAPGVVSLAGGLPAPELFPADELQAAFAAVLATQSGQALQYGPSEGYAPLRALLAERSAACGVPCTVDQVLLTTGSQQALDLVGRVLLDPGDYVAVESPTYLGALQAFSQYQPRYLTVPTDEDGLDVEALEALLDGAPGPLKLLYVVPNFQNPSGRTLSLARRRALAALSNRRQLIVVEDDPYGALRYEGEHLPSVQAFDEAGTVIYLSTFSKVIAPGLRLGWVVASQAAVRYLLRAKQPADLCTAELIQLAVYRALQDGLLERQIPRLVAAYRPRRDALLAAAADCFPPQARLSRPAGGMFAWVELPAGIDTEALLAAAVAARVAYVPGRAFHADGGGRNTLRLNFTHASEQVLGEAIERLGIVLAQAHGG